MEETSKSTDTDQAISPAHPDYPANVKRFVAKWQPEEDARQKAFWKEFRKAANAYADFKQNSDGDYSASSCSPRCDNCRWGSEMEERYDQRHCVNEESPEAFGDVESSFSCQFFEENVQIKE